MSDPCLGVGIPELRIAAEESPVGRGRETRGSHDGGTGGHASVTHIWLLHVRGLYSLSLCLASPHSDTSASSNSTDSSL